MPEAQRVEGHPKRSTRPGGAVDSKAHWFSCKQHSLRAGRAAAPEVKTHPGLQLDLLTLCWWSRPDLGFPRSLCRDQHKSWG
jgi:hypothetical protein